MSEESLMAWCMEDLLPRMHMTADLRIAKDRLHLNPLWHVTIQRQQVGQAFVEGLCFSSHTTWIWKYKWGEDATFNFEYTLAIHPFLYIFMLVHGRQTSRVVAGSIGVKYPHIKIGILVSMQNPLVHTSSHAPSSVSPDASLKVSPDNGSIFSTCPNK